MHLNSKQIFLLLSPFLVSFIIYYFDTDITSNVKYLFPNYEEYSNKVLDKKADIYLKISAKDKHYQTILQRLKERNSSAEWIANDILYKHIVVQAPIIKQKMQNFSHKHKQSTNFELQAIFNNKKVAIINGKMVRASSFIDGAQILKIEKNRVLLQYNKGTKWVYLFH